MSRRFWGSSRGSRGSVLASDVVGLPVSRSHLRAAEAPQSLPGDPGAPRQPHSHLPQASGERLPPVLRERGPGGTAAGLRPLSVEKRHFPACVLGSEPLERIPGHQQPAREGELPTTFMHSSKRRSVFSIQKINHVIIKSSKSERT